VTTSVVTEPGFPLRPDHVGISVGDLEASISWYRDMLGFELLRVLDVPDGEGKVALLRAGSFLLELFAVPGAAPVPEERQHPVTDLRTQGVKHMAYAVADLRGLIARMKARGVEVVWEPVVHDDTLCAFVRDNSGNLVELVERTSGGQEK